MASDPYQHYHPCADARCMPYGAPVVLLDEVLDALREMDPVEAALAGQHAWEDAARRLAERFGQGPAVDSAEPEYLPGCPVEEWDGPYQYRCALGDKHLRCSKHGPFERAKRCTKTAGCRRPEDHGGTCDPAVDSDTSGKTEETDG